MFLLLQISRNNMKRRNTESKEEILSILNDYQSPMSYDMIVERISVSIDRATVYRILNRFQEDGLTHKVVGPDGKQYFALCGDCEHSDHSHSHNHLHFQCLECHSVECLSEEFKVTLPKGYRAKYYNTFITGYCKSCNAA